MNKVSKIISVALVLVLALSVMVMPTSAATPTIKADVVAEYQGKTTAGLDYYLFRVYLDSTLSINAFQCNITWDNSVFQMLRYSNKGNATAFNNLVIWRQDPENCLYKFHDYYDTYGVDGSGDGCWFHDDINSDYGYAFLAADAAAPTAATITDTNMGEELTAAGYTGAYVAWANIFTDSYLNISGGTLNGANSPDSGKVCVMSWYMAVKEGAAVGDYEVGFNAKQAYRLTGTYMDNDAIASRDDGELVSIRPEHVTYTNATITVADAGLEVAHVKDQIRFEKTDAGAYNNKFDVRTIAQISGIDTIFDDDADITSTDDGDYILEAGFLFNKGTNPTIDLDTAKAQIEGGTATYTRVNNAYISTSDGYKMACFINDIPDADKGMSLASVAYVIYTTDGGATTQYAYFDTVNTANFNTLYTTYHPQAFPA